MENRKLRPGDTGNAKHPFEELDGLRYYRKEGKYYYNKYHGRYMHRAVWEKHNGKIPEGYHVHHKDHDCANNNIENLEIISASDHAKLHAKDNKWVGSEGNKKQLLEAQELAKLWHSSEEGRSWHAQNGRKAWEKRKYFPKICERCSKEYQTAFPERSKYCSNNCKSSVNAKKKRLQDRQDRERSSTSGV